MVTGGWRANRAVWMLGRFRVDGSSDPSIPASIRHGSDLAIRLHVQVPTTRSTTTNDNSPCPALMPWRVCAVDSTAVTSIAAGVCVALHGRMPYTRHLRELACQRHWRSFSPPEHRGSAYGTSYRLAQRCGASAATSCRRRRDTPWAPRQRVVSQEATRPPVSVSAEACLTRRPSPARVVLVCICACIMYVCIYICLL